MQYLSVGPQNIKDQHVSYVYSMLKQHKVTFDSKLSATKMRILRTVKVPPVSWPDTCSSRRRIQYYSTCRSIMLYNAWIGIGNGMAAIGTGSVA
ncbi:hypothetical protein Dsin_000951 [Dipteronia sinensis]|uniref:Uncharacterized protein n=1 Tax=Dipteronia sinensis TaxID=43782 RepID=A0AAE0B4D6_9ROSI|nr:hypothetical protein Dsin_000951 [Dipteronia sinensis]